MSTTTCRSTVGGFAFVVPDVVQVNHDKSGDAYSSVVSGGSCPKSLCGRGRLVDVDEAQILTRRLADYEQTTKVIANLTEVRFKLAAFVPVVTGGAVSAIGTSSTQPRFHAVIAAGGLMFVIGIVLYDLSMAMS